MRVKSIFFHSCVVCSIAYHAAANRDQSPSTPFTSAKSLTSRAHISRTECSQVQHTIVICVLQHVVGWCGLALVAATTGSADILRNIFHNYFFHAGARYRGKLYERFETIRDEGMLSSPFPIDPRLNEGRVMIRCDDNRTVCRVGDVASVRLSMMFLVGSLEVEPGAR